MSALAYVDHRQEPEAWARKLGVSRDAINLYLTSDVIDLHIESFSWVRAFGYDLRARHEPGLLGARFFNQADFPRVLEAQLSGATWVITTNPLRDARARFETFCENLATLRQTFETESEHFELVTNGAEYRAARRRGRHAVFLGIQGGNALDIDLGALDRFPSEQILRITLVHLSSSRIGTTSSPLKLFNQRGLSRFGCDFLRRLNEKRIFVDLAHISPRGFWDAVSVHDRTQPLLVTHTGVSGAHRHWRNLDDAQLRAVAETGGTIGIMYHSQYLGDPLWGGRAASVFRHIAHAVACIGDEHVSLGSDWDGGICTPRDMPTCLELPRLVQLMLDAGWNDSRIQRILGTNFLRVVTRLRG